MTDVKPESTQQTPINEAKEKPVKVENVSRCELIRNYAAKGIKAIGDKTAREVLADKVFAKLKEVGKLTTKKGKAITVETIKSQISSIVTVVEKQEQKHWQGFEVVEQDDKYFKLFEKPAKTA